MIDLGVSAGDRVAIWSPNTWHWVVACLATHYAGGVLVPLNTRYTASEATDILARTGAPLLVAAGEFLGADKPPISTAMRCRTLRHIVRVPIEKDDGTWDEFMRPAAPNLDAVDARAAAVKPDDVSDILFTSGTTGRSKGALCAHRQSLAAPAAWAECGQVTSDDRYLCINPFFHNFGYKAGILACLQTGATLIPQLTFDPEQAMQAVHDAPHHRAARAADDLPDAARPSQARRLRPDLAALRGHRRGRRPGRADRTDADRAGHRHRADRLRPDRGQRFGTMCRADDDAVTVATTCGRPIADFELRIESPTIGRGAAARAERHARLPRRPGGHRRGDRRRRLAAHRRRRHASTSAGNLKITDRLKDMYICGGFNVYPAEVEQVLARLDGVAESRSSACPTSGSARSARRSS